MALAAQHARAMNYPLMKFLIEHQKPKNPSHSSLEAHSTLHLLILIKEIGSNPCTELD